jgi:hypothetical protein
LDAGLGGDLSDQGMTKRIAIIQSCYIPWRGFFDLIDRCDEYVVFDSVQFAKRHWHNRNVIKTPQGATWLTIPVATKSRFAQPIDEVEVSAPWAATHWASLKANYARAPHFAAHAGALEALYTEAERLTRLSEINWLFLRAIMDLLDIKARLVSDREYAPEGARTQRLLDICRKAGATHYLSGPSARDYLDVAAFAEAGIAVEWMGYGGYPDYPQCWGPFAPAVTVLDMICNVGAARPDLWRGIGA